MAIGNPVIIQDELILESNNGYIIAGDYVVISESVVDITYNGQGIDFANIILEKDGIDGSPLNGNNTISVKNNEPVIFSWKCNITPVTNEVYPVYRIKIESLSPIGIIAYSNYFKISVPISVPI